MADYRLILKASIDEKSLKTEIDRINSEGKYPLKLKISPEGIKQVETAINKVQQGVNKSGKGLTIIDTAKTVASLDELRKRIQDIQSSIKGEAKLDVFASVGKNGEEINRAVISYTDNVGKAVRETYTLKDVTDKQGKAIKEWGVSSVKYSDDIAKATRTRESAEKKVADEMARSLSMAEKFLERSKDLAKTTQVNRATDIAKQIQALSVDPKNIDQVRILRKEFENLDAGIRQSGHAAWSWSEQIGVALQRTIQWGLSVGVVYGALNQLKSGVQYIKDLDKEMTNIQIATGITDERTQELATTYNGLARELGATTLEVAESATTWLKQGKTVEESGQLIKATMMVSKMAMVDSAQAAEYLTSVLNGYQMEVSQVEDVVSKMVSVDNASATSVAELANALQRSANVARVSGVSFETLVAWIGTVSSVTRRSAETIGESFKTMFSRMSDIQKGAIDETGVSINEVERSLDRVGIALRDSDYSFRDFEDVLGDVAKKWNTLDEVSQADILTNVRLYGNIYIEGGEPRNLGCGSDPANGENLTQFAMTIPCQAV